MFIYNKMNVSNGKCALCACILIIILLLIRICMSTKRPLLYVWPLWGIGNRLRTVRVCYNIANKLGHELVILEHYDEGFDEASLTNLVNLPFRSLKLHDFKRIPNVPVLEYNDQCTLKISSDELDTYSGRTFCIRACAVEVTGDDALNTTNEMYKHVRFSLYDEDLKMLSKIFTNRNLVGVHIRQGNVNDWARGYFFNEEWRSISEREPTSSPQFCCFANADQNISACTSNVTPVDSYIEKMKQYPSDTQFFVCADRTGCLLYLHQMFPNRIHMLPLTIQTDKVNTKSGLADFVGLSRCSQVIVSHVSSFADEARRVNDIPVVTL
jgi:hypothetical protein